MTSKGNGTDTMRMLLFAFALALPPTLPAGFAAAQSEEFPQYAAIVEGGFGAPIPAINMALVRDGVEVAADTTDATGFAELPAAEMGEYSILLQDPVPADALILVIAARQEWSAELGPGRGDGPAIQFPAEQGDLVQLWLVAMDENYAPAEPGEPVDRAPPPLEHTHGDDSGAEQ